MTKVLVVDDEIPEQRHLSEILYSSFSGSVTLQCANNGKEAVAQATLWNPDIVLMDIEMPQMDGYHLTKLIKENDETKDIPVVIFSSLVNDEMRAKGEQLGVDAQLSKPEIVKLVEVLDGLLLKK